MLLYISSFLAKKTATKAGVAGQKHTVYILALMSDTKLLPVSCIQRYPSLVSIANNIDIDSSPAMSNNSDDLFKHNAGASRAGGSTPSFFGNIRFATVPLLQNNAPKPVPLRLRIWHSSQGTPVVITQPKCIHRVTLQARDALQVLGICSQPS